MPNFVLLFCFLESFIICSRLGTTISPSICWFAYAEAILVHLRRSCGQNKRDALSKQEEQNGCKLVEKNQPDQPVHSPLLFLFPFRIRLVKALTDSPLAEAGFFGGSDSVVEVILSVKPFGRW